MGRRMLRPYKGEAGAADATPVAGARCGAPVQQHA